MTSPRDRLFELFEALVDERLSKDEHAELERLLKDDPEAQRRYLAHVELHLGLHKLIPREEPDEADPLADLARAAQSPARPPRPRPAHERPAIWGALAAALLVAAGGIYFWPGRDVPVPVAVVPKGPTKDEPQGPRFIAGAGARFFGENVPASGSSLRIGHAYALAEGQVQIDYANQVRVILEGPAAFEIPAADRLAIRVGECSVTVPKGAEGFRVETPLADVVDLGTRFAVQVAENGLTDVQVVEGRAEVHKPRTPGRAAVAKLQAGEAVRCQDEGELVARPLAYDSARYRRQLADRVVRYQAAADPGGGVDELVSVTVQRGGETFTWPIEDLIGVDLVHFKAGNRAAANNLTTPQGTRNPRQPSEKGTSRGALLDRDRRLTTGVINPGGARESLTRDPVMNDPEQKESPNTPGLGVRFARPVTNGPGPDVVLFDLHVILHPERGDAFHVSPLRFAPGLKSHTVRRYDIDLASPEAQLLAKFLLYRFDAPPTSRSSLEAMRHDGGAAHVVAAKGLAVGIDLSDLGYPAGAQVEGLFFQDALDDGDYFDPVFIAGFPMIPSAAK